MPEQETVDLDYAWVAVGAPVVIVSGAYQDQMEHTTISRVTARDVVLDNGERFRRSQKVWRSGGPVLASGILKGRPMLVAEIRYLFPPDNHRVVELTARAGAPKETTMNNHDALAAGLPAYSEDPVQRLAHTLAAYPDRADSDFVLEATRNTVPGHDVTGLTFGDLRALLARVQDDAGEGVWQWGQGDYVSGLMDEREARYWAQRQNNRTSSIGNEARVRRLAAGEWREQDNYADYERGIG